MKSIRQRLLPIMSAAVVASVGVACSDQTLVTTVAEPGTVSSTTLIGLVISSPFRATIGQSDTQGAAAAATTIGTVEMVYVSLPAKGLPTAASLTIRNVTTGSAATAPIEVRDGGFDPVAVPASAGNELELKVTDLFGAVTVFRAFAPRRRPPGVVRTSPASGANDVALNFRISVVFTEPIAPTTLTAATVQLLRGNVSVTGRVSVVAGSLFVAEFVPDEELTPDSPYRLVVTRGVRDAEGDSLDAEVSVSFTTQRSGAISPMLSVVAGVATTCALRSDGKTLCWGANKFGQLGAGNDLVATGTCSADRVGTYFLCRPLPGIVAGAYTFTALGTGFERTCGLTAAGEAVCWGRGASVPSEEVPVACDPATENCNCDPALGICNGVPQQVTTPLRFTRVESGYAHSCGIRTGGGAFCWGAELFPGVLGTGDGGLSASPLAVRGAESLTSLASGSHHVCGLTASGVAYCWGLDLFGQLGVGGASPDVCKTDTNFVWPCAKSAVPVSGGHTFVSLVAGWSHSCGLAADGRTYCWGEYVETGSYGSTPTSVSSDVAFVSLSDGASASHTCGVTADHVAYCWGNNAFGQLGDGATTSTLRPVRVQGGLAFSSMTTGAGHTCGITTAGETYCWGDNRMGQLGVGATSSWSARPLRVIGL